MRAPFRLKAEVVLGSEVMEMTQNGVLTLRPSHCLLPPPRTSWSSCLLISLKQSQGVTRTVRGVIPAEKPNPDPLLCSISFSAILVCVNTHTHRCINCKLRSTPLHSHSYTHLTRVHRYIINLTRPMPGHDPLHFSGAAGTCLAYLSVLSPPALG